MKKIEKAIAPFAMLAAVFTATAVQAQPSVEVPKAVSVATTTDWTLKPQPSATAMSPATAGFDLQAALHAKGDFNKNTDNDQSVKIYQPDDGKQWQESRNNRLRPEINVWQAENGSVSIRPKGRGVMIGFKIKMN
jgi:hypothetical protein